MRPISSEQDPLRYPLNAILGTQAHVRLLRVMANEVEGPLTASDIARRAGLTLPGAQKALEKLLRSGFVSRVGGGRKHQYEIRRSDRLMQMTLELFQAEKKRYEQLLTVIKNQIKNLVPPPHAAWMQTVPKEIDAPLMLGVLQDSLHLTDCVRQLRAGLSEIEKHFDLTIELEGYTKADIPDLALGEITPLYGALPTTSANARQQTNKPLTHEEKDRQLNILSQRLADALQTDPALIRRAKDHIDRLLQEDRGAATMDVMEWRKILDTYSIQHLARFFTSSSERANRLRQSNPFFAVLNAAERTRLVAGSLEDKK
jgi:predicted transcriptional regulator